MRLSFIWQRLSDLGYNIFIDNFMSFFMKHFYINTTLSVVVGEVLFWINFRKNKNSLKQFLGRNENKRHNFYVFSEREEANKKATKSSLHMNMWTEIELYQRCKSLVHFSSWNVQGNASHKIYFHFKKYIKWSRAIIRFEPMVEI